MKTNRPFHPSLRLALLLSIALAAPLSLGVHAQATPDHPAARHMAEGLALEQRGDTLGALAAFRQSAEAGHAPAQRRLGDLYAKGNSAVERDFEASTHWYAKARAGGEQIPEPAPLRFGHDFRPIR